jgi:hypothetical protein
LEKFLSSEDKMDKTHLILSVGIAVYAGVRLYQKYIRKKSPVQTPEKKQNDLSSLTDDYEPYSKK